MNRITPCGLCLMIILALALPSGPERAQAAGPLSFDTSYTSRKRAGRSRRSIKPTPS